MPSVCLDMMLNLFTHPTAAWPRVPVPSSCQSLPELGWKASAAGLLGGSPHLTEPYYLICKARVAGMPTSEGWPKVTERVMGPNHQFTEQGLIL